MESASGRSEERRPVNLSSFVLGQYFELDLSSIPFFRHHVLFTLTLPVPSRLTFLPEHGVEVLLLTHHSPDRPGRFIGHGYKDDIGRSPCQ